MAQIIRAVAPPSGGAWTPAEISTALWLDAADSGTITESGGAVSAWNDKSENGLHVSQATAGARPARQAAEQNGLDVLRFAGDDFMERTTASALGRNVASALVFAVRRHSSAPTANRYVFAYSIDANPQAVRLLVEAGRTSGKDGVGGRRLDADGFQQAVSAADSGTSWGVQCGAFDYQNTLLRQYINGTLDGENASFHAAGNTQDTASARLRIGANLADAIGSFLIGDVAEIVVVHDDVTSPTRQRIEGYLAHKWGLEGDLPGGHPYKESAPTTAWTPADMETALWLDAAQGSTITEVSGAVSQWDDKSGNGRHATQATAGSRPAVAAAALGGLDVVRFDGVDDVLAIPGAVGLARNAAELNVFLVARVTPNAASTYQRVYNFSVSNSASTSFRAALAAFGNNLRQVQRRLDADAANLHDYAYSTAANLLFHGRHLWSSATVNYRVNGGSQVSQATGQGSGNTTDADSNEVAIGGENAVGMQYVGMDFAEFVVIAGSVNDATRQRIEGYLAHKWGLEGDLPSGHPYKAAPPTLGDPWTPAEITTALWLDATDASTITESGGRITQWADKSGNARHHTSPTSIGPVYTANAINTQPAAVFTAGDSTWLARAQYMDVNEPQCIFAVADSNLVGRGVGATWSMDVGTSGSIVWTVPSTVGVTSPSPNVAGPQVRSLSAGHYIMRVGHTNGLTNGIQYSVSGSLRSGTYEASLGQTGGGTYITGAAGEVIQLPFVPSVPLRQRIEGYLAHKWGLAAGLDAGHPYKGAAPTSDGLWTPDYLPLSLWLDASDEDTVELDGSGNVEFWRDKSGYGLDVSQATAGNRPAYGTLHAGKKTVNFDASNSEVLEGADPLSASTVTAVTARDYTVVSVGSVRIGRGLDGFGAGWSIQLTASGTNVNCVYTSSGATGYARSTIAANKFGIRGIIGDQGSTLTGMGDGTIDSSAQSQTRLRTSSKGTQIGRGGQSTGYHSGDSAEVLFIRKALTTDERQKLEGYLAHKWGLEGDLPGGHPYKAAPPTI